MALPLISGIEVCRQIKGVPATSSLPVIILTAKDSEQDRVMGFEAGADDYVTKPFSPQELVLRVSRAFHRAIRASFDPTAKPKLRVGEFCLEERCHELRGRSRVINLTAVEFRIITLLMENAGIVLERYQLRRKIWGSRSRVTVRTIDSHIMRLRSKLGSAGEAIETVRGFGYRIKKDEHALDLPPVDTGREGEPVWSSFEVNA